MPPWAPGIYPCACGPTHLWSDGCPSQRLLGLQVQRRLRAPDQNVFSISRDCGGQVGLDDSRRKLWHPLPVLVGGAWDI